MNFEDLTDEQKAKACECKTLEDILALAKEEGYELSKEELEEISGGWCPTHCGAQCHHQCDRFIMT